MISVASTCPVLRLLAPPPPAGSVFRGSTYEGSTATGNLEHLNQKYAGNPEFSVQNSKLQLSIRLGKIAGVALSNDQLNNFR